MNRKTKSGQDGEKKTGVRSPASVVGSGREDEKDSRP